MGIIIHNIAEGKTDFPYPGADFVIEDNVGDDFPVHIHFGDRTKDWKVRFHFTYDEFYIFAKRIIKEGVL